MKRPASLASTISIDNAEGIATQPVKRRRTIGNKWTVFDPPTLPYLYLKEKTSAVVLNDSPQEIANRIVATAKGINCIGEYDDVRAQATLSVNGAEFGIQLFKVTEKTNACIIVEMHRIHGSPIIFHTVARNIIAACKNVTVTDKPRKNIRRTLDSREDNLARESELFPRSMETVTGLLQKDRVDAKLLGMESLQLLTSPRSSSDAMVSFASDVLLTADSSFMTIRMAIITIISKRYLESELEQKYHNKMRICALNALSNALDAVTSIEEDSLDNNMLSQLLTELSHAESSPHEAYLASKCLKFALAMSIPLRDRAVQMGALNTVMQSKRVGHQTNHLLGSVADDILQILEKS
uniref:PUL domain-containing protein n=1 Tax=Chaetoceros debilis TaxID=122233 RepID=A0A7S3V480_9STRA|mmetsp:Transcript_2336/g.3471  ORF Transcript_2336/g.3471 Transcript_2336/m.3471 type:complete len:353 (+) Transcript_2336:53-1111(+)|eukprot:CAMPEP_0194089252 /NCGR_PEP_ID=MMETSP0149-20130528/33386_1 /TAXON_ID=122233 /ORGANISM="Chaetoceros debilis, Strain MM31A-1" /LENGTH=352 /DNA_ID=CAMNT_0038773121 /DNA_START=29 /DNA_END=1087 /DNA_ORIENTATION=-